MITTQDEELVATKKGLKQAKHDNYNLGFDDVKCSTAKVIREARLARYLEGGWLPLTL